MSAGWDVSFDRQFLFTGEALLTHAQSEFSIGISARLGMLNSINLQTPIEFMGEPMCDRSGCQRERVQSHVIRSKVATFTLSLIKSWGLNK